MGRLFFYILVLISIQSSSSAQEYSGPLFLQKKGNEKYHKLSSLTLPLRDDFSSYDESPQPSALIWMDNQVYVNNHFSDLQYNKGMATFDGLDTNGNPYSYGMGDNVNCDSLTSLAIDLSTFSSSSGVYLSFQYLPKGLGYQPNGNDSLKIYFNDGLSGWTLVDFVLPDTINHWQTKMIPITESKYFNENFQIRFVNRATMGINPGHWHIDNFYLNHSRNISDTVFNDLAFTSQPSSMLKDFTSMPYKHFNTNKSSFLADGFAAELINRQWTTLNNPVGIEVRNQKSGSMLYYANRNKNLAALQRDTVGFPMLNPAVISEDVDGNLSLNVMYFCEKIGTDVWSKNDTITRVQEFQDYFAYDDGSSEQSYYLNLFPGAPGRIAVEFYNYAPDTIAGIDIQFANPSPSQQDKEFFVQVYKNIEEGSTGGTLLYEQQGFFPRFSKDNASFERYVFDEVVPLGTGQFFVVIMMPAGGISDSLMISLDGNRVAANHRLYSVEDIWVNSILEGALMLRPVMSGEQLPSSIEVNDDEIIFNVFPNPTNDRLYVNGLSKGKKYSFSISEPRGRQLLNIKQFPNESLDISWLPKGIYFLTITDKWGKSNTRKFVKK